MAAEITQAWLTENVGEPSEKYGSKYSAIYKKTGELQRTPTLINLTSLLDMVNKWSYSTHCGAKTPSQILAKDSQQRSLNEFAMALKRKRLSLNPGYINQIEKDAIANASRYPTERKLVLQVLGEMQSSPTPLIQNTGIALARSELVMLLDPAQLASMKASGKLTVNPHVTRNKNQLIGTLVHEYHHLLCVHDGTYTYADEFVAHWKEYSITKPKVTDAARVIEVNETVTKLYKTQVNAWKSKGLNLLTSIDQAGDFLVPDNLAAKSIAANINSAPRA